MHRYILNKDPGLSILPAAERLFLEKGERDMQNQAFGGKMQKITTHLWYDREAKEAAEFYTSVFSRDGGSPSAGKESFVKNVSTIYNTPSGTVDIVTMELYGQGFTLISAGPFFKFTPAVSFLVSCNGKEEVDALWKGLSEGGQALMELGEYPFSKWYGWTQDRFGLSWQIMLTEQAPIRQKITPMLLFVGNVAGKAEEAIRAYTSIFSDSRVGDIARYGKNEQPDREGTVKQAEFTLEGMNFRAMDSAHAHKFGFNEAVSFVVHCATQQEIDHYWGKLSAVPEAEQCGWLKDRYGVSWQIVPTVMEGMLRDKDRKKVASVTEAFLKMKKFDIAALQKAYAG